MNSVVITLAQHTPQMGRLRNSEQQKKEPISQFLFRQTNRPAILQNKTSFPILSVKPKLPHSAQTFSFVQPEWPLTWGLPAQFVSPLIMIIHYPTLHIKTRTGSFQARELGRWTMGKKHNHLHEWCSSRVSFLSPQQKEKISSPPDLTEVVFIINHCSIRFIYVFLQDHSAVDVPGTKDAAGKASLCPSVSARPLQRQPGEGGWIRPFLAATGRVVLWTAL